MKLPDIAGTYSGKLVICGGGRSVWDDLGRLGFAHGKRCDVMCINDIIMHFPYEIDHAFSNDFKMLPRWLAARRPRYSRTEKRIQVHKLGETQGKIIGWPFPGHGTSGLNATYIGAALGYDEIILCGIPLDDSGHYFDAPWVRTNFIRECGVRDGNTKFWGNAARNIFKGKVKSMSGRTRDIFGEPEGTMEYQEVPIEQRIRVS